MYRQTWRHHKFAAPCTVHSQVTLRALCVSEVTCGRAARGSAHLNMQSRNHTRRRSLRSSRFATFALLYPIPCAFHHQFYLYHYFFPFLFTSSSSASSNRKQNVYLLPPHCIKQEFLTFILFTAWTPLRVWWDPRVPSQKIYLNA